MNWILSTGYFIALSSETQNPYSSKYGTHYKKGYLSRSEKEKVLQQLKKIPDIIFIHLYIAETLQQDLKKVGVIEPKRTPNV